jgi:hypothetical protein
VSGLETNSDVACWPGPYGSERRLLVPRPSSCNIRGGCSPSAKPTLVGRRRRRRLPLRSLRSGWLSNCATTTTFRGSQYGATTASTCFQRGGTFPTPSSPCCAPLRGRAPRLRSSRPAPTRASGDGWARGHEIESVPAAGVSRSPDMLPAGALSLRDGGGSVPGCRRVEG